MAEEEFIALSSDDEDDIALSIALEVGIRSIASKRSCFADKLSRNP